MRYISEYRNPALVNKLIDEIFQKTTRPWTIMEICGGQTHAIMRYGLDQLLPESIELVHGPGCPVCVTPIELIDKAIRIASMSNVIFTSFGDMLRVPGTKEDLFSVRASGGDVRVVYSPLDAISIAQNNPNKQVVFFAIGFETTAPANAMALLQAKSLGLQNFSLLISHMRVPPAIRAILSHPENRVQGFLAAGHVCSVMGYWEYHSIAREFKTPIVVTGFEPVDLLRGILKVVSLLENEQYIVENAYQRVVTETGNISAQKIINTVFQEGDRSWRGIGLIKNSGWFLKPEFQFFDAETRFELGGLVSQESTVCISGEILTGNKKPFQCQAFATLCKPETPLGATMVSSEGACAAYYHYRYQMNQTYE